MGLKSKILYDSVKSYSIKISVFSLLLIALIPFIKVRFYLYFVISISTISLVLLFIFINMHQAFKVRKDHTTNLWFRFFHFFRNRTDSSNICLGEIKGFMVKDRYIKVDRHHYYNIVSGILDFFIRKYSIKKFFFLVLLSTAITTGYYFYGMYLITGLIFSFLGCITICSLFFSILGIDNYYLNPAYEANANVLVSGESGSGKSTLLKKFIFGLHNSVPVLAFDIHSDFLEIYRDLGLRIMHPEEISINLWDLEKGISPEIRIRENISLFDTIIPQGLGKIQQAILFRIALACYNKKGILEDKSQTWVLEPPNNTELIQTLFEEMKSTSSREKESIMSLYKTIKLYSQSTIFGAKTQIPFQDMLEKSSVISLADLRNSKMIQIVEEALLRKLYYYMLGRNIQHRKVSIYIIIDELNALASSKETMLIRLLAEGRKFGLAFLLGAQIVKTLPPEIVGNCATKIMFRASEFEDFSYLADMLASTYFHHKERKSQVFKLFRNLKPLQAMIINSTHKDPVKVKVTFVHKTFRYRQLKKKNCKKEETESKTVEKVEAAIHGEIPADSGHDKITLSIIHLLEINHGAMEKTRLLFALKISDNNLFYRSIDSLMEKDMIKEIRRSNLFNKTYKYIVINKSNKSAEHSLEIKLVYDYLLYKRFNVRIMDQDNVPDIEVEISGVRFAVEIETGSKKDNQLIVEMLRNRSKVFSKVVIVTEDFKRFSGLVTDHNLTNCEVISFEGVRATFK